MSQISSQNQLIVVLDPTGLYDIPDGYILITTEREWIQFFGVENAAYWVQGKLLCDWAQEWLRVWQKIDAIAQVKQNPRSKLTDLFHPLPIPTHWTDKKLLTLATQLDNYPQENLIAYLLADITKSDLQIWLTPNLANLAALLAIQVPQEDKFLEQVWQQQVKHELAIYYQNEDKLLLLRRWLGIAQPALEELGKYPLQIPDFVTQDFDNYWQQQLYQTEAKVLDNLNLNNQVGMDRIAAQIYQVLSNRPNWITKARETKITGYLSYQQKVELQERQPPPQPQSLALDATPEQALHWATQDYLPFRRWEIKQPPSYQKISDRLADSFVKWILQHYLEMKVDAVEHSYLNYSVTSQVQKLCQESPVLWVVVDGLGWLDHLELLSFLTQNHQLQIETSIEPKFSILPTKTEYAKWSLYAQLPPSPPHWVNDMKKGFAKVGIGKRYTDGQIDQLYSDLRDNNQRLYCWDTELLDKLYHSRKDWQSLYKFERPKTLKHIAQTINDCLQQYPNPDKLRIVIASDHGQIMGVSAEITHCPKELEPHGRMALGKTDDPRFVVLESDRYNLPHDISIVRNSETLNSFRYTNDKQNLGSHGGLFPEEVVIGFSVLRRLVKRLPVFVSCRGEGKPKQAGSLEITIDNPNSVPLTNLHLSINQLASFDITETISANKKKAFELNISECPELPPNHQGKSLSLSGELSFRFANAEPGTAQLDSQSAIIINQIFSSGLDIDEFL